MSKSLSDELRESVLRHARQVRQSHLHDHYAPEVLRVVELAFQRRVAVEQVEQWFSDTEGRTSVYRDARSILEDLERARAKAPDMTDELFEILRRELGPSR